MAHVPMLPKRSIRAWNHLVLLSALGFVCMQVQDLSFSFGTHPSTWREQELSLNSQRFNEHLIDLNTDNTRPRRLRILRQLLSSSEVTNLLALIRFDDFGREALTWNPVRTPCQVVATDGQWKEGTLSDFLRPIIEQQLLPYMKRALGYETLAIGQVVLRQWSGSGTPRSCTGHRDHQALGTAVLDLTPVNGSGLWVQCGSSKEVEGAEGAFFVPVGPGDVAVHGWDVVHGVHLKDGHERISVVVWTIPAEDLESGLCSWYLAEALQEQDPEAAYGLGVEAWRQRMLGEVKLQLLQQTLDETFDVTPRGSNPGFVEMLSALGGTGHAVKWQERCHKAMGDVQDLKAEAEALKKGDAMKGLGQRFNYRPGDMGLMRRALQRGWDHARLISEEMRTEGWSYAQLGARTAELANATATLTQHGLAIFEDPADQVDTDALRRVQEAFGNAWGRVLPSLQRRSPDIFNGTFQFREVCSRSMGRFDVRLPELSVGPGAWPWMSFVHAALGDAKELSRGVLLSSYGSTSQPWHRDSEHLFQTQLPLHAMTIFTPLVQDLTPSMGFPSFIPGSHSWHRSQVEHTGAVTPLTRFKSWLAFDNRILHRGEANLDHLQKRDRSWLYFVYAKPWFQDVRNFPPDAPSVFDELEAGSFYTV